MPKGVKVEFHPEEFEIAIERHGQYVRWYSSMPCYCVDELTRMDPMCKECRGRGYIYTPIKEKRTIYRNMSMGGNVINTGKNINTLYRVQEPNGTEISYSSFNGSLITLSSSLKRGIYYEVDYIENLEYSFVGEAIWEGNGLLKANITPETSAEGDFIGTISEVTYLKNTTQNIELNILEYWENRILTDHTPDPNDEFEISCKYLKPIKFLIVGIKGREERMMTARARTMRDERIATFQDYDATLTFPGYLVVGAGDLITLLKAEQKMSAIGVYKSDQTYKLPFFHINRLVNIRDKRGDIENVSIIRKNELMFNGRTPDGRFSVSFMYLPTFVVSGETPSLRYGEDKVFPKVVGLKRFDITGKRDNRPSLESSYFQVSDVI